MTPALATIALFGGSKPWSSSDWTSSDDRVRGGTSQSYLTISPSTPTVLFHGNLDTKTLGGAGFASQRTTGDDRAWDLSSADGILLDIVSADDKKYTLNLKDQILPPSANGSEQSTISWEYDFSAPQQGQQLFISWEEFKPTYRGREKKDAAPLDLANIKRISIMMRSFFSTQEGDFSLRLRSISATEKLGTYRNEPKKVQGPKKSCPKDEGTKAQPMT